MKIGSKTWRRQAATLALVEVLSSSFYENRTKVYKKDEEIFRRIRRWCREAKKPLLPQPEKGIVAQLKELKLPPSLVRAWERTFLALSDLIDSVLAPGQVDLAVILSALLVVVEDVADQVPPERKRTWDYLVLAIAALYRRIDPDWSAPGQELGQRIGERMKEVIWQ